MNRLTVKPANLSRLGFRAILVFSQSNAILFCISDDIIFRGNGFSQDFPIELNDHLGG